jgi:N-terminal domain of CBF1 interacting co-repressor CIR
MPLHLLHHKSWHVYNTDNIEKVRRDQQNAQRKEEEDEMRMNQADQERRLQQLRGNAYNTDPERPTTIDISKPSNAIPGLKKSNKHINLFEDLEKVEVAKVEGNPAREAEKAAENKKWEDMITSKFVNATSDHKPWYSQLDKISTREKEKSEVEKELREKKQAKWKDSADPLKQMERYLEKKRDIDE